MFLTTKRAGRTHMLYAADEPNVSALIEAFGVDPLYPDFWHQRRQVVGEAPGRGTSLFVQAGNEQWALRQYRRGGMVARLSQARYLWTSLERTRAFREMRLTAALHTQGLPVPKPVAAGVSHHGLTYEASLITVRIPGAHALAEHLTAGTADSELLRRVGVTIRQFHDAGLDHVDLNARNLLVDAERQVWLIDLDRCRLRPAGVWQTSNLERLSRSLEKFGEAQAMVDIQHGYEGDEGADSHERGPS